jgi:hypothetical protein
MTHKDMTNDEAVSGSKTSAFGTFIRHVTNLKGTFIENVKKSKINPPK